MVAVTHNGADFLQQQLASIERQFTLPDEAVVVDDNSTDDTIAILRDYQSNSSFPVQILRSSAPKGMPVYSRVAANFTQGVASASGRVVLFADQDDLWLPSRVDIQTEVFLSRPSLSVVAHDGVVIDALDADTGGTLRGSFPVPSNWWQLRHEQRVRFVMRHPVGTGAAMAIQPARLGAWAVPPGWLHDRWLTLHAVAFDGLELARGAVIRYRVHDSQAVGLAGADRHLCARIRQVTRKPRQVLDKLADESRLGRTSPHRGARSLVLPTSAAVMLGFGSARDDSASEFPGDGTMKSREPESMNLSPERSTVRS